MKFSADYRALALDALRGRWKTAVLAGLIASLLGANIVSSSDRVISNMSQNANGDTPGFAGLFSTGSGGVLAVLVICILAWAVFTVIVGGAAVLPRSQLSGLGAALHPAHADWFLSRLCLHPLGGYGPCSADPAVHPAERRLFLSAPLRGSGLGDLLPGYHRCTF